MKLVLLDRCTLTAGDLDFSVLDRLCDTVEYYDILPKAELLSVVRDADLLLCNKAQLGEEVFAAAPKLKFVGLFATGYNNIDIEAASRRNIAVANVPGYSTDSVAQLTFSMILSLATNLDKYNASTHSGDWIRSYAFSYFPYPIMELRGKTLGIFGLGAIGRQVAKIADAIGMRVIYCARAEKSDVPYEAVDIDTLFSESDFLSFHCPLTPDTAKLVNDRTLSLMKKSAYLINTARGGVIDEKALYHALAEGRIAGAALDVMTVEPMAEDNLLLQAPNCIITPHVAWASSEARKRLLLLVAENIKAFLRDDPINLVSTYKKAR